MENSIQNALFLCFFMAYSESSAMVSEQFSLTENQGEANRCWRVPRSEPTRPIAGTSPRAGSPKNGWLIFDIDLHLCCIRPTFSIRDPTRPWAQRSPPSTVARSRCRCTSTPASGRCTSSSSQTRSRSPTAARSRRRCGCGTSCCTSCSARWSSTTPQRTRSTAKACRANLTGE